MRYDIKAIPTEYKECEFRSRLEATWAAFFDIIGWKWSYEPFEANGYIPDFLISGVRPFLVEVKPFCAREQFVEYAEDLNMKLQGNWNREVFIAGASPFILESDWGEHHPCGGFYSEGSYIDELGDEPVDQTHYFSDSFMFTCNKCGTINVAKTEGWWLGRICDHSCGDSFVGSLDNVQQLWNKALNLTKWRPKAGAK